MEELKNEELAVVGSESQESQEKREQSELAAEKSVTEELEEMLAEAERRGYLRARNEIAEVAMRRPRLWENPCRTEAEELARPTTAEPASATASGPEFLSRISPGIWD